MGVVMVSLGSLRVTEAGKCAVFRLGPWFLTMRSVPSRNHDFREGATMTVQDPVLDETFAAPADATRLERAAAALQERGYTVHLVDSADAARTLVAGLL